ncbi:hypothetical protein CK556_01965 [Mesoplasma chauliocola]|uniref:DUF5673 domain-containing protein n=1 Tax=Mesoplasma chauliocola TaxID=216427 RepID=A0A249SNR3_9MOLU|nr:hypothetical protein [Mesoplasma chauliocola]ASZ09121.1 hypothetical protein CK556_01965 [Mesoplasma chauliocola]
MKVIIFPLIVSFILIIYSTFIFIKDLLKINKIIKLIKQENKYFKNVKLFWMIICYLIILSIISLLFFALTIFYFINQSDNLMVFQTIVDVIYMLLLLIWITYIQKKIKSVYLVVKNSKLLIWDKVFDFKEIISIKNDSKRKNIIFKVQEEAGYEFVKVTYHWELKDFLKNLDLKTEFI